MLSSDKENSGAKHRRISFGTTPATPAAKAFNCGSTSSGRYG